MLNQFLLAESRVLIRYDEALLPLLGKPRPYRGVYGLLHFHCPTSVICFSFTALEYHLQRLGQPHSTRLQSVSPVAALHRLRSVLASSFDLGMTDDGKGMGLSHVTVLSGADKVDECHTNRRCSALS